MGPKLRNPPRRLCPDLAHTSSPPSSKLSLDRTHNDGFLASTSSNGGKKFAVLPCATPILFGPSKRALCPSTVPFTARLAPPYCQFIFKTLTGFTRLDRLGFHAAPLPSAPSPKSNCLVRRACHLRLSRSGCVGCLVLGRGVTGHGPDWPAAPGELGPPDRQKFGLRAELHSGILLDIALSDVSSSIHAPQRHFERQLVLACHTRRAQ